MCHASLLVTLTHLLLTSGVGGSDKRKVKGQSVSSYGEMCSGFVSLWCCSSRLQAGSAVACHDKDYASL